LATISALTARVHASHHPQIFRRLFAFIGEDVERELIALA
jgi:hypothetical protein